ncbi:cation:proton antiporter regulatory subunit [Halomarina pelagica]|uniref:cation:proton antiporter regulatory subunit n=1 Tax=Halomarina pelagica TaxID=2961599 RepID=UPI0020C471B4|nr:TrkA C-terminal domain-containing protein [Halomarina sp. BND7]
MVIYEADVPGVGKRYEVETGDTERFVVIVHHDGKREIFRRDHPDADAEKLFEFPAGVSREIVTALQGVDFQPLDLDDVDMPLGNAIMEWVEIPDDSPLAGETIQAAQLRQKTGATVAAIQREDDTLASPKADTVLQPGDILVVIGTRPEQKSFESLIKTGSTETSN